MMRTSKLFPFFFLQVFFFSAQAQTVFLYAHGLGGSQEQARKLYMRYRDETTENKNWLIDGPVALFDFPDSLDKPNTYSRNLVNLGQDLDVERLHFAYQETLKRVPDAEIVLVGLSRGATTVINYVGIHQPKEVKALVLESPFYSFEMLVAHQKKRFYLNWLPDHVAQSIMHLNFPLINFSGVCPAHTVHWIPKNLPIILIHAKNDKVTPFESSRQLVSDLKNNGNEHAYLLEFESGAHGKLMWSQNADTYQSVVHAFFKRYDILCDDESALRGMRLLDQCR